jgi:hypothetical protein
VKNDQECGVEQYSVFRNRDCIVRGHTVLRKLLEYNIVPAASGMVRRELYEKVGLFPLNMTWIGDWYLWSAFALYADVAFFSEPMVCYRKHEASMESSLVGEANNRDCLAQVLEMFWTLKVKADEAGFRSVSKKYLRRFTEAYGRHLFSNLLNMSLEEFEDVLSAKTQSQKERKWIRARAYAVIGDQKYHRGERALAMKFYQAALQADPLMAKVLAKSFLLSLGKPGDFARKVFRSKGTV